MARSHHASQSIFPPSSSITLAIWRLHQTWRLLCIIGIGMIAAVMLVCATPLYSRITMSAGLYGALTSSAQNSDIVVKGTSNLVVVNTINDVSSHLHNELQKYLGSYLGPSQTSVETMLTSLLIGSPNHLSSGQDLIHMVGEPISQSAPHLQLIDGRLPQTIFVPNNASTILEIALTPESLATLKTHIGASLHINISLINEPFVRRDRTVDLHIVGVFTPNANDPYWHGNTFESTARGDIGEIYTALMSTESYLSMMEHIYHEAQIKDTTDSGNLTLESPPTLIWYYRLDPAHIEIDKLSTIVANIDTLRIQTANDPALNREPAVTAVQAYIPSDILKRYNERIAVAQIPITGLLILIVALILFFISMMADVLVDHQSDALAILSSRGASRNQLFSALVIQSFCLGFVALLIGPVLAFLFVQFIAPKTLAPDTAPIIHYILHNPSQVMLNLSNYALLAAVVTILAMIIAVLRVARSDVVSMRREAARSTRRPLWERLNLDIVAVIVMLTGYGFSVYLTNSNILDTQLRLLLLTPLTLAGSVCLLIAGLLLLLRFFPQLLQLGSSFALRGRGAAPMLAMAQMARTPRQALRMTLLLALATAFAIFTLVFSASQAQRIIDVSNYQGSADFSGTLTNDTLTATDFPQVSSDYNHIPGVNTATVGYQESTTSGGNLAISLELRAVDANNFAKTAIWTEQDSSQSLTVLMKLLMSKRESSIAQDEVSAIVDEATWNSLHLDTNPHFTLNFPKLNNGTINFIAIAKVSHIPSVNDSNDVNNSSDYVAAGGVLADFETCTGVYLHDYQGPLPINYVMLKTKDDDASLKQVRKALTSGDLQLDSLYDRRANIVALHTEPLYVTLIGLLALGTTTAMLLALVGNLIASWLSGRSRSTNFAVLRALGSAPPQIANVLIWEQFIIYATAIVLGVLFGITLSLLAVPTLLFTSVSANSGNYLSNQAFYLLQSTPPTQVIFPPTIGLVLLVLIAICGIALTIMIRVVTKPAISQALRLNED